MIPAPESAPESDFCRLPTLIPAPALCYGANGSGPESAPTLESAPLVELAPSQFSTEKINPNMLQLIRVEK